MSIWFGILCLAFIALLLGLFIAMVDYKLKQKPSKIVDQLNNLLPQTQCGQCGYVGCRPYAQAITQGELTTKCTPGGIETAKALSHLMGIDLESNTNTLIQAPQTKIAFIREEECVGCVRCIQACPVDAIIGATNLMHTVINDWCTGCELCVPACPVHCIEMLPKDKQHGNTLIVNHLKYSNHLTDQQLIASDRGFSLNHKESFND